MHKILQELNLPGSATRPVIVPRKSGQPSSENKITLQLELPIAGLNHKPSNKE
ncbi:MAG TPA: hypothetical protein VJ546_03455 [Bacillales bacterium]|nr:hypothetical protein [Bacillales bacterium]